MIREKFNDQVSVSGQITTGDIIELAHEGIEVIICNRPDGEAADQTDFSEIQRATNAHGLTAFNIPFMSGQLNNDLISQFNNVLAAGKKTHAYCRTGNRSTQICIAAQQFSNKTANTISADHSSVVRAVNTPVRAKPCFDIVIVGAGSGGIAVSASLLKRNRELRIAIIDSSSKHYYQPGWTMVGSGIFSAESCERDTASLIGRGISHIKQNVLKILPDDGKVILKDQLEVYYQQLIVAPGLTIDWAAIEGLEESLGKNGVTSNYRYDLASYTWELVQKTQKGKAIFTQPSMPIKCAGAPQKALYLSADYWQKCDVLKDIDVEFCNAGGVLFGVAYYVPALMKYIKKYDATLSYGHNLIRVDGENQKAWFEVMNTESEKTLVCKDFDMLHVCPVQRAPEFIKLSNLSDQSGWLNVNPHTLQHVLYKNIWGLGDVMNTGNAKTMAAVRKQVPVVANNVCNVIASKQAISTYDGYGACPLTVERGKIVLAEFCYDGRISPTFPGWVNNGAEPTRAAWWLKAHVLPTIYWMGMLKGHEWLTKCQPEL